MNFSELYNGNREAVSRALKAMWCGEANNESQKASLENMKEVIDNLFAPGNAFPVVQCMNSYKTVYSTSAKDAKDLVGGLWKFPFEPYEHQYLSWKALLKDSWTSPDGTIKPKSIVVTTGTGSGKTECFMMPLVHDLISKGKHGQIQALFLYPLNALMEDQKERLEQLLEGTTLTYSVYNGDLPEKEPTAGDTRPDAERLRQRIAQLRGEYLDPTTGEKKYKFSHMLYTREDVRKTPPNILLTNPTMLEYILLRGADAALINPLQQSLDWVVIDETHTYTGAGAAELAMLLRRVLIAFGRDASDIHFATSSATFGNTSSEDPEEAKRLQALEMEKLRDFIAGITGINRDQVEAIGGERNGEEFIPEGEDALRWRQIFHADYIPLDKLYPGESTISEKLQWLDEMCQREETRCIASGSEVPNLKVKVHYFYRVPNNGLYVRLPENENGSFKIYTQNTIDDNDIEQAPLLELGRCRQCGEYVAVAKVNTHDMTYSALVADDSDMFDLVETDDRDAAEKYVIFGLSNATNVKGDNNAIFSVEGNKLSMGSQVNMSERAWHLVGNTQYCCPCCNTRISTRRESEASVEGISSSTDSMRIQKFRLSADFISRMMAPSILDQLEKHIPDDPEELILHEGQQYISFVDSRQAAAKSTLSQNLEQERMWFYTTIYHELCKRAALAKEYEIKAQEIKAERDGYDEDSDEWEDAHQRFRKMKAKANDSISWMEIAELLKNDKYCPLFCTLFIKRSAYSEELDENGDIKESMLDQYIQSIMTMYLTNRPASAAAPETMGLFHSCYPQLKKLRVPEAVKAFNELLTDPANKITDNDWRDLIEVFMDYTVRSNQSVFLKIEGNNQNDIFSTVRFATEKPRRRPVNKPQVDPDHASQSRIVRYLCALIRRDSNDTISLGDAQRNYFQQISDVVDAFWDTVNDKNNKLLEEGQRLDDNGDFIPEKDHAPRLNLVNISFKLYTDVYLCDTKTDGPARHIVSLRPISTNFKRFSPYLEGSTPTDLDETLHETWEPFPYYAGSGNYVSPEIITSWAKTKRRLLWDNRLWGEDGLFSDRLMDIHMQPNLFVQAEHTAQVDKDVARELQSQFKSHSINILACSTTMEMGVDLGNLEVVMLSSVPPQPSNYKQRAGRSGRNNKVRSACITLCGSDAIGLRTLFNPVETIINRPVHVPSVDLMSPQVIQRHVNSFLVREFGVFTNGSGGGSLKQKVVDFYTNYTIEKESANSPRLIILDKGNNQIHVADKLGDETGTMYEAFNKACDRPLEEPLKQRLTLLLHDTVFDGKPDVVIKAAKATNKARYSELSEKLEDYAAALSTGGSNTKFRAKLELLYLEVLNDRLLNYWATNRFTPNANMPVSVLSLDLNTTGKRTYFTNMTSANPSYSLREAIAQYAPGNRIVVDGVVYTVRGIETSTIYQSSKTFKKIYRNASKTVIDDGASLVNKVKWNVNDRFDLELVQPASFMPDMNEGKTRISDSNTYTRVSAQLIDADEWNTAPGDAHLFSVRPNRETGNAKILYYNEGLGYGYCYCPRCGRMVLEDSAADPENPLKMPFEMNSIIPKNPDKPKYHLAISGKDMHKPCSGSNNPDVIRRNVIIGDLIQTDFSEIRLRHKGKNWFSGREDEENLLFTLGIVFTQALVDILGKERGAVDFAIMPNGHLCIFDTNPGGAGYSNQLANIAIMEELIAASKVLLETAKQKNSKDMLLDKFTLRFMKYIDIDAALEWIAEEQS